MAEKIISNDNRNIDIYSKLRSCMSQIFLYTKVWEEKVSEKAKKDV